MVDSTAEEEYSKGDSDTRNRAMSAKLGSKEGTNRDGTRGASTDVIKTGSEAHGSGKYAFFGSPDGRNDDTFHRPDVNKPSKPTLGDY